MFDPCFMVVMKKEFLTLSILFLGLGSLAQRPGMLPEITPAGKGIVNTRIDNIGYWKEMVLLGFVKPGPVFTVRRASFTTSRILGKGIPPQNSPDIPVSSLDTITQSENSLFIDPVEEGFILNSNNSTNWTNNAAYHKFGADGLFSENEGMEWKGTARGAGITNSGDPSTAIGLNGWLYVGKISDDGGQSLAYSSDRGITWKEVVIVPGPTTVYGLLDKNHLCIDNATESPYKGNLYAAWTNFIPGSADTNQIQLARSSDHGIHWSSPYGISREVSAGKLNHGVNIQTGPEGEVYAVWSIYDTWPSDEVALGFTKSIDGGGVFTPSRRIFQNIKGIRASLTGKNMRVNSFPSMAVDNSTGPNRGMIYVVWANVGFPGINTGNDIDIYLIRSSDQGETWSEPIRVNQDIPGLGKQHFFPWITCDDVTGGLCVVYYDDRNLSPEDCETYVSYSYDGGLTWDDLKVSDVSFTPSPISGLAFNYFGDYIGIRSLNMKVYPVWTDNRSGRAMAYVSPFDLGPNPGQAWVVFHHFDLSSIRSGKKQNMNYGDSLFLSLGLKNIGDRPAYNVHAVLSSGCPYILITDSLAAYGEIDSNAVKTIENGFAFKVSDTIPDNLSVRFEISIRSDDSCWFSHFSILSQAPGLQVSRLFVIDTTGGNHNGHLDPGETVLINIENSNTGYFPCDSVFGHLLIDSPLVSIAGDSVCLEELQPGQTKNASFSVKANEDLPLGTTIHLQYNSESGKYRKSKFFRQVIGIIAEDWETNTFGKFPWQLSGNKPWTITEHAPMEGTFCSQSGHILDYETSVLSVNYSSAVEDSISFYLKTSTEADYDFLFFYIDDVFMGSWSGVTPWKRASFPVSAGAHLYTWKYKKDLALSFGEDKVWVDMIVFPAPLLPDVYAGENDSICPGQTYRMHATVSSYDSIRWGSSGDGRFDSAMILNPVYTPGQADILSGNVQLKINVYANHSRVAKSMMLSIGCEGKNDQGIFKAIRIFPNPGNGHFTLEIFSLSPEAITIRLSDERNVLLYLKKENITPDYWRKKFNFATLPAGSYLLSVESSKGCTSGRLIIVK